MSCILCIVMIVCCIFTGDTNFVIAAGLFAIGSEICDFRESKEKGGETK